MAKLARAVHVTDPKSGRRLVLAPGEEPAPHLAALVLSPSAWADGKLPRPPKAETETQDGQQSLPEGAETATPEPAAKKTAAAKKPARGRTAADEGTGGD